MSRLRYGGWEYGLNERTIESFRQNTPELVIRDAKEFLGLNDMQCRMLRSILMARGVNKWLKARREIIWMKHEIKRNLKQLYQQHIETKKRGEYTSKSVLKYVTQIQTHLNWLCKQPRWVEWPEGVADAATAYKLITSQEVKDDSGVQKA